MRFSLLLYALYRKMRSKARKSQSFRNKVKEKNITFLIKTTDGKRARSYTLLDGAVTSKRGDTHSFDFALVWSDAATGYKVMASGSDEASMEALKEENLRIEGDGSLALWFTALTKEL